MNRTVTIPTVIVAPPVMRLDHSKAGPAASLLPPAEHEKARRERECAERVESCRLDMHAAREV